MFEKGERSRESQEKIIVPDFDSLVEKVKRLPENEGQTLLWTETYKLPKWYFIVKQKEDIKRAKPFIGEDDGKGWFFVFTDGIHVHKFAESQRFLDSDGQAHAITMEPLDAASFMSGFMEYVYGVQFNTGEHGWFTPIANLLPMYERLKDLKKI